MQTFYFNKYARDKGSSKDIVLFFYRLVFSLFLFFNSFIVNSLFISLSFITQGVHKVFRQFKKFITKAVDEISYIDLFYINQCLLKFLVKLKFSISD